MFLDAYHQLVSPGLKTFPEPVGQHVAQEEKDNRDGWTFGELVFRPRKT